jgi:hypothetical protein
VAALKLEEERRQQVEAREAKKEMKEKEAEVAREAMEERGLKRKQV